MGKQGRFDEAITHLQHALKIKPYDAEAHYNLGMALNGQGKIAAAVVQWREAVRLQPNQIAFVNHLVWLLATCPEASVRNGAEAVELAHRAVRLSGGREPAILDTLAAALAEAGRFPEAVQTARMALERWLHNRTTEPWPARCGHESPSTNRERPFVSRCQFLSRLSQHRDCAS